MMIQTFEYPKLCCCWILRQLTDEHKIARMSVLQQLLLGHGAEDDDFHLNIVSGNDSCLQQIYSGTKLKSME
jgi:hypothetical protein